MPERDSLREKTQKAQIPFVSGLSVIFQEVHLLRTFVRYSPHSEGAKLWQTFCTFRGKVYTILIVRLFLSKLS